MFNIENAIDVNDHFSSASEEELASAVNFCRAKEAGPLKQRFRKTGGVLYADKQGAAVLALIMLAMQDNIGERRLKTIRADLIGRFLTKMDVEVAPVLDDPEQAYKHFLATQSTVRSGNAARSTSPRPRSF